MPFCFRKVHGHFCHVASFVFFSVLVYCLLFVYQQGSDSLPAGWAIMHLKTNKYPMPNTQTNIPCQTPTPPSGDLPVREKKKRPAARYRDIFPITGAPHLSLYPAEYVFNPSSFSRADVQCIPNPPSSSAPSPAHHNFDL